MTTEMTTETITETRQDIPVTRTITSAGCSSIQLCMGQESGLAVLRLCWSCSSRKVAEERSNHPGGRKERRRERKRGEKKRGREKNKITWKIINKQGGENSPQHQGIRTK
jgi:hypothetical protein